ncbi:MAG: DUF3472 domain-containing protein [Bacteroidales bacterium]
MILSLLVLGSFVGTLFAGEPIKIPLGGNAYVVRKAGNTDVSKNGISAWDDEKALISAWFKVGANGNLSMSIKGRSPKGTSKIEISVNGKSKHTLVLDNSSWELIPVCTVKVLKDEYVRVDFKGLAREGDVFADISDIIIDGEAAQESLIFVREAKDFHFGRRGPSVHLAYQIPESVGNAEYFYNEITVPKKEDVIGSYFMVNGFGEGYCGIQINSETERRVLFSVWSPHKTDNPNEIPEEAKVHLLGKGKDVIAKDFGGEGSGGQSFLRYSWEAGKTYKFLTRIHPDENRKGATVYTSWFFDPKQNNWRLIASFSRPMKVTWYTRPHSFLENFIPSQGYVTRKVMFGNQWIADDNGNWFELEDAKFTYDATARAKRRNDYYGGLAKDKKHFVLKNCGFFDKNIEYGAKFSRTTTSSARPIIDFDALPEK